MCAVSLSSSAEAWGSSGTLNGEAMADILAVLMGSSLLHIHTQCCQTLEITRFSGRTL